ncbi:MAG: DUF3784 domain-containing protein [Peptostreptococcaceae bacterium]|nr:DUF3784 domain-containing protein [Peptostreptococcaceae bacterium]
MLFDLVFLLVLGLLIIVIGLLIWKKEKIDLIHSYHYQKVAETDKRAYTSLMGKGTIIIGTGMIIAGAIDFFTRSGWGWIVFGICSITGLSFFIYAGKKYNR